MSVPVLFVHGWSVTHTSTYGELPKRLVKEARARLKLDLDVHEIWLGKYVSFHDEVTLDDLARGFESALQNEKKLIKILNAGQRFICITHSTGAPVVREWWHRFYLDKSRKVCPMSHLIMLAPANFGSALAQLGKSRVGRLKSWFGGVEPGVGVLNWLELGSPEAWALNRDWIERKSAGTGKYPVFPFVLAGQVIDRKLYDHLNSYTDEVGSDGVVRVAAANLNATYVRLRQKIIETDERGRPRSSHLELVDCKPSPATAFGMVSGRSHAGKDIGIMASVRNDGNPHPTVDAIIRCLKVQTTKDYRETIKDFARNLNPRVFDHERIEVISRGVLKDHTTIRDACSMVIFRLQDEHGNVVEDFDLVLTGDWNSPDGLPTGFFFDRQRNRRHAGTLTYFFNYSLILGSDAMQHKKRGIVREATDGLDRLGLRLKPRPDEGFAHYVDASISASPELLDSFLKPHQTTLVDITLRRVVRENTVDFTQDLKPASFRKVKPGGVL